ncbi:MAG: UDP-N-acetylmuramate--L-alanine ligase [Betaproteobacteria bacterium]
MTSSAERVGAGLAAAREPHAIRQGERIHVVGGAGAGASAAALLAARAGARVTACDPGAPSPYTPALEAMGIPIATRHDASHVIGTPAPDRLAVTKALTAIDPDHPELVAARARSIPLEPWQQVVADAAVGRTLVAVAGTHGKSTTAGWLVHVLVEAGEDPSAFVGALLPSSLSGGPPATARSGTGPAFVVEADEYAGNFDPYHPEVAILTSAEWDHPDVFADGEAVGRAFEGWIRRASPTAVLIANVGDPGVEQLVTHLSDWPGAMLVYALLDQAPQRVGGYARAMAERFTTAAGPAAALLGRVVAAEPETTGLEIQGLDPLAGPLNTRLPTAGRHNAANALAVAAAAMTLGVPAATIVTALGSFAGVGRRLEWKGTVAGITVYDDYGHHPTAIRETLAAVRQRAPGRRVWAVLEPLTYHRTAAMLDELADALSGADAVAVADIWAGRDPDTTIASPDALASATVARRPGIPVLATGSVEMTAQRLAAELVPGDVVLVMGGGRSYRIGELLLERLEARP